MPYYLILFLDISNIISVIALRYLGILNILPKCCRKKEKPQKHRTFTHTITRIREGLSAFFSPSSSNSKPTTSNAIMDTTMNVHATDRRQNQYFANIRDHEDDSKHAIVNDKSKMPYDDDGTSYRGPSEREKVSFRTMSNHTLGSSPQREDSISPIKTVEKDTNVQTHNLDSLSMLGDIGEVIFDKTDVLTFGKLTLKHLATRNKDYQFDGLDFTVGMTDFRNNPELYNQDDSMEEDSQEEDENYSEKMQEYQKELNCEYDAMLMDSDEDDVDLSKIINQLDYSKYLADPKINMLFDDGQDLGSIVKPESKLGASKDELSSFCHMLKVSQDKNKQNIHFSSRNLDKSKAQEIAERIQRAINKSANQSPKNTGACGKKQFDAISSGVLASQKAISSRNISNNSKAMSRMDEEQEQVSKDSLYDITKGKHNEEHEPIKINFAKDCGTRAFISDLANRKYQLDELINYLYLFQECGSLIEHRKINRKNKKSSVKTAVTSIFTEFGYQFKSSGKRDTQDAAAMINQELKPKNLVFTTKISSEFGVVSNFIVKLVNEFTNHRKRMSLIVFDTERSTDSHYLIVNGEEKYMCPCLLLSKKNKNQYKMLVSRYKMQGLKPIVVAIKVLDKNVVDEYMNSFVSILKTSRDQIENLEKLAISMETDLSYFGMIGVIDEVRPDAKELCYALRQTGVSLNMFSGDSLQRCLHVVKKLKFTTTDFVRSGEYIHLNFKTEERANIDIKRIFDTIYNMLKKNDIMEKSMIKLKSKASQKNEEQQEKIKSWLRALKSTSSLEIIEQMNELQMSVPRTPILISGPAVGVIMKSPHLTSCLQAILILSESVILHSAQPAHSIFMIDMLKKKNNSTVLAIGDGFNYFGIMRKADVSIQITHSDVPLIFGDFLVGNLRVATHLLFYNSFHVFKANLTIILIEVWRCLPYAILASVYLMFSEFSGILATRYHLMTFYLSACGQVVLSGVFNTPYKWTTMRKMHSFYIENKFSDDYNARILVFIIISAVLESIYIVTMIMMFVSQANAKNGHTLSSIELVQDFVFMGLILISTFKHTFLTLRRIYLSIILNIVILLLVALSMFLRERHNKNDILERQMPGYAIFTDLSLMIYFAFLTLVPIYANFCTSLVLKSYFLSPFCRAVNKCKESKTPKSEFLSEVARIRTKLIRTVYEYSIDEYIIKIKQCFQRNTGYAPITKIAFIDSFTNKVGLSHFTNTIHDSGVAKRFKTVQMRVEKKSARRIVGMFLILTFTLYWIVLGMRDSQNYALDTMMPYAFLVGLVPFAMLFIKTNYKFIYSGLTISMTVIVFLAAVLVFSRQDFTYGDPRFALSRLIFSSIPIDYKAAVILGTICDVTSFIK